MLNRVTKYRLSETMPSNIRASKVQKSKESHMPFLTLKASEQFLRLQHMTANISIT